ncbi:MAG: response regulator transcription factor [Pirellulaceae bacterium]
MNTQLLIVEDDVALATMVSEFFAEHGFETTTESDGSAAIKLIGQNHYDAVILDIALPGADGLSVCRAVRPKYKGPIIVLTARGEEIDEVVALEVGADDFMAKPVRPRALLARLKVHLRRSDVATSSSPTKTIKVGDLTIDEGSRNVVVAGENVDLTTAEFELLLYLAQRAGSVVERKAIFIDLLELPYDGLDRSIDLRVSRLRRKLNDDPNQPERIKSIRGIGYLMARST